MSHPNNYGNPLNGSSQSIRIEEDWFEFPKYVYSFTDGQPDTTEVQGMLQANAQRRQWTDEMGQTCTLRSLNQRSLDAIIVGLMAARNDGSLVGMEFTEEGRNAVFKILKDATDLATEYRLRKSLFNARKAVYGLMCDCMTMREKLESFDDPRSQRRIQSLLNRLPDNVRSLLSISDNHRFDATSRVYLAEVNEAIPDVTNLISTLTEQPENQVKASEALTEMAMKLYRIERLENPNRQETTQEIMSSTPENLPDVIEDLKFEHEATYGKPPRNPKLRPRSNGNHTFFTNYIVSLHGGKRVESETGLPERKYSVYYQEGIIEERKANKLKEHSYEQIKARNYLGDVVIRSNQPRLDTFEKTSTLSLSHLELSDLGRSSGHITLIAEALASISMDGSLTILESVDPQFHTLFRNNGAVTSKTNPDQLRWIAPDVEKAAQTHLEHNDVPALSSGR
ncbi:hypothetical protein [Ferrimonas marina]|uniref:Uncharacterized protein n=1 Tax=Ferrimonas marina TaxID=299255 RepID=A0A1M5UC95_9GAMM|nr:hypothetical protein [Ferrimonas marina]SHH60644.1 hypothetical protein SAMN02745129_2501 [Ferrimonas marina]